MSRGGQTLNGRWSLARAETVKGVTLQGVTTIAQGADGSLRPQVATLTAQLSGFEDVPVSGRQISWCYYEMTVQNGQLQVSTNPIYLTYNNNNLTLRVPASAVANTAAKARVYSVEVSWGGGRVTQSVSDRVTVTVVKDGEPGAPGAPGADGRFLAPPVEWQQCDIYVMTDDCIPCVYKDVSGMRKYYALKRSMPPDICSNSFDPEFPGTPYWRPVSSIELVVIQKAWIQYLSGSEAFFDLVKACGIDTTDKEGKNGLRIERNMISFIGAKHPQFVMGIDADGNTVFRFYDKKSGVLKTQYNPETGLITTVNATYSWKSESVQPFKGADGLEAGGRPNKVYYYNTDNPTNAPLSEYTYHVPAGVSENVVLTANPNPRRYKAPAGWYKRLPGIFVPAPVQNGVVIGFPKTIYMTFHVNAAGKQDQHGQIVVEGIQDRS
uniref:Tail n=1 Tax=Porphyromonas phage phage009a_Kyudai3 TaxID=3154100 RepID=A0AAT9J846_9VIRU